MKKINRKKKMVAACFVIPITAILISKAVKAVKRRRYSTASH